MWSNRVIRRRRLSCYYRHHWGQQNVAAPAVAETPNVAQIMGHKYRHNSPPGLAIIRHRSLLPETFATLPAAPTPAATAASLEPICRHHRPRTIIEYETNLTATAVPEQRSQKNPAGMPQPGLAACGSTDHVLPGIPLPQLTRSYLSRRLQPKISHQRSHRSEIVSSSPLIQIQNVAQQLFPLIRRFTHLQTAAATVPLAACCSPVKEVVITINAVTCRQTMPPPVATACAVEPRLPPPSSVMAQTDVAGLEN